MAVSFFLIGLDLKHKLLVGQLSEIRRAASVMCAALGGIIVPAALLLRVATAENVLHGYRIPIATDTAFALAILVLLGTRVPQAGQALRVGLAIADEWGAILIAPYAYPESLHTALHVVGRLP